VEHGDLADIKPCVDSLIKELGGRSEAIYQDGLAKVSAVGRRLVGGHRQPQRRLCARAPRGLPRRVRPVGPPARGRRGRGRLALGAARLQSTLPARSELPARIQPYLDSRPSGAAAAAAAPDYDGAAAPFVHVYEDAGTAAPLVLGRAPGSRVVYDSDGITVTTSS
jgi:hypothetical protein